MLCMQDAAAEGQPMEIVCNPPTDYAETEEFSRAAGRWLHSSV